MKEIICSSPFFGITVSIAAYSIGVMINRKTRLALFNPLLVSYLIIIPLLLLFDIPLEWYDRGGDIINMFLSPATAVLAITIYRQRFLIKEHLAAVIAGTAAGSICSILLVLFLCRLIADPQKHHNSACNCRMRQSRRHSGPYRACSNCYGNHGKHHRSAIDKAFQNQK